MLERELTVLAAVENLAEVTAFVDECLEALDFPMKAQLQVDTAVDEIFSNIAYYAYAPAQGPATVLVSGDETGVSITFQDSGVPFNPLNKADPDTTLAPEDRAMGGLGIFMVKKMMDGLSYDHRDGKNILRLRKNR